MNNTRQLLEACFLFRGLPEKALENIHAIGTINRFRQKQNIFMEGEPADGFHIIMSGRVKIFKLSSEGREQILHLFGPGEPFGEAAVFAGDVFPANAMATEDTETFYIPRKRFVFLLEQDPSLAMNLLAIFSKRLMRFARMIGDLSLKEVPGRVATYLLILMNRQQTQQLVTLDMTKTQLASLLGTIPETLSRIFARMQKNNIIKVRGRQIEILDMAALQKLSGNIFQDSELQSGHSRRRA
ncbi:MAG: Crp/Fnr family transcriptional regulator [Thermodesulfatator sp.]|nr:MAG: Crp/Fnr family transcriptional regulator [Thermodesulfatator sp.]